MNDKNFEETVSLIKSWIKEGSFGDKEQHWCEIFLGVTLCPEARFFNKIYVPFPRKILEDGAAFKAGKTIFPMKSHGGFYDPSLNVFTEKFAFEVIIEKNFKGPLVLKDIQGLLKRYKGVDKIILGIHSEKRFDELTNIFHQRSDLLRFFTFRSLTKDFNSMPRENFKAAIKKRLDKIENPVSVISSQIKKPTQIIQPWMFGDEAMKKTCLWLKNLPKIEPTDIVGKGEFFEWIDKKGRKKRQALWCYNALSQSKTPEERRTFRSKTFPGMANAIATQFWNHLNYKL